MTWGRRNDMGVGGMIWAGFIILPNPSKILSILVQQRAHPPSPLTLREGGIIDIPLTPS